MNIEPGARFTRLVVVERVGSRNSYHLWRCRCDCGGEKDITSQMLRRGLAKSCGCLRSETASARALKHGHRETPIYGVWKAMLARCRLVDYPKHRNYGGKGVRVCARWASFENFLADMGERPDGATLDRYPNQRGDYEPGNCRWATPKQQRSNSSQVVHYVTHGGETMSLVDWAARLGLKHDTIYARFRRGLPPERVLAQTDLRR